MTNDVQRREFLLMGGAATGLGLLPGRGFAQSSDQIIPWLDQPMAIPPGPIQVPQALKPGFVWTVASGPPDPAHVIHNLQRWEDLTTWITPNDRFFNITHYNQPEIDPRTWSLEITGLVDQPLKVNLEQLRRLPRKQVTCTVECSGNRGLPFFTSGIGTANWAGAALAPLLRRARPKKTGTEVVFIGHDAGDEVVRDLTIRSNFARSMSLDDAMNPNNILCYEMNGATLPASNGFPLRLIAPGWYGIANVKWLKRIEVRDTRFMGRFMARDYVTVREESHDGETFWSETSVGRWRLASAPARVIRDGGKYRILGMAWGASIARVEVQIDGGAWRPAAIDKKIDAAFAWKFWSADWDHPASGEHTVTSRAFDTDGNVQPTATDPLIAGKHTYWESNGQAVRRIRIV
jgi:DMSO/TMAO reductase YedYZ molybdopterin-dependent catalytic subunit